jgi:hypothetical protein
MRTTITFDDDTAVAVEQVRRERGIGVSAAVNELIRRAMARPQRPRAFVQRTSAGHARIDVTDIGEVLDTLDGPATR